MDHCISGRPERQQKNAPPGTRKRHKKELSPDCDSHKFLTQSGLSSPNSWYLASWLPLFLQIFRWPVIIGTPSWHLRRIHRSDLISEISCLPSFPLPDPGQLTFAHIGFGPVLYVHRVLTLSGYTIANPECKNKSNSVQTQQNKLVLTAENLHVSIKTTEKT